MPLTTSPRRLVRGLWQSSLPGRARTPRVSFFSLVALCSTLAAGAAYGQLSFAPGTHYTAGPAPRAVALGDLDHDGRPDLVVANSGSNTITVRLNQGGGSLGSGAGFATGSSPVHVALADLDSDGNLDAVAANQGQGANSVSLLFGDGTGAFAPRVDRPAGNLPTFVAIGDLNHDGRPDLVVADNGTSEINVLINLGNRQFAPAVGYALGGLPVAAAIGQLDDDSHPDVATGGNNSNVYVFPGTGSASLGNWKNVPLTANPIAITIADVTGDGRQDLVVALYSLNRLVVIPGKGTGADGHPAFGTSVLYATGTSPVAFAVTDLSGDGWIDAAVANFATSNLSIYHGDGHGNLSPMASVTTQLNPISVASADVNGDGLPDLATANLGVNSVSIFLQNPSPPLIRVIPTALAFGQFFVGLTKTLTVRIQNIGSQPLTITNATINGSEYSVLDALPFVLARGQFRDLQVRFAPVAAGTFSRTLTILSNDATHPSVTVALSGSAAFPPDVGVSPGSMAFTALSGNVDSGILEVSNSGEGLLTYSLATVAPRPSWLTFTPALASVGSGEAAQVTVRADATGMIGGLYSAVLRVSSNDPVRPRIDVPIAFTVIGAARIAVTPPSLAYGGGYVGFSQALDVNVRNTGTETLVVSSMTSNSPEFTVPATTPFTVAPAASRVVQVVYRRLSEGSAAGTLSIAHNDPTLPTVTVPLSGSAADPPRIAVTPAALERVIVSVGDSVLQSLTVSNTSHATPLDVQLSIAPVSGLSATPPFGVAPGIATIGPGGSLDFVVAFRGVNRPGQDLSSTLGISSNDPATPLVQRALALHVRGTPQIGVAPGTLDFGTGFVGVPDTLLLGVSNPGNDTLHVSGMAASDPGFSVLDPTAFTLIAGATRSVRVRCARSAAGNADERLTVSGDDPVHPSVQVRLLASTQEPPVVRVSPTSISVAVALGDSTVVPLSIVNNGLGPLDFSISVRRPPPPAPLPVAIGDDEKVFSADDPNPVAARAPPAEVGAPYRDNGPHTLSATRVLVIGDGGTESDVIPILTGAGYQVTLVADDAVWNGSNPSPDAFGTVVLLDGIDFGDDMPVAGQQALLDFVRGGGGVVVTEWISYEVSQGRYASMRPLVPITRATGVTGLFSYTVVASHPVTEGVSPTFAVTAAVTRGTVNSGTTLVRLSTGDPAVVVKDEGLGRVAAFAIAGNYNGRRPFLSTDVRRLLLNAVSWTSGFRWLSWSPRSGQVIPGGKGVVNVKVTTLGLAPGTETVELLLDSNDPTTPRLVVPLRVTVLTEPTPVLASLVRQEAEADRVRLVWHVAGADLPIATVFRSRTDEGWRALREVEADGSGLIVFEDRDVSPGERYGYRITVREAGAERIAGETWLATPGAVFALHGVWPTPSDRDLVVSFSLPDRRGGRIELFDVRGRRWMELPLDRLGPGRHDANLDPRGVAPPGIYWVRLTSGARSLTARAILLR